MKLRKWLVEYIPMLLTAALIVCFAVIREQSFLKTLPTLITLIVQLLLVHANRYAFLLGSANSVLYGIAYFSESLYFSTASALLISMPIQLFSFFHWKKHTGSDQKTELKFLSMKQRLLTVLLILVGWGACYFGLAPFFSNANYPIPDILCFVMGIAVSLLSAFRYIDSQYLNLVSLTVQTVMWILITLQSPESFNYIIISVYNAFRVTQAAIRWTRQYQQQKIKPKENAHEYPSAS